MPDRYAQDVVSVIDAPLMRDGDKTFIGLNQRDSPENLPEGMVQVAQNIRLTPYPAITRKGLSKQTNSIYFTNPPLIIPFTVGTSAVIVNSTTDGIYGAQLWSDPNGANAEYIVVPAGGRAFLFTPNTSVVTLTYPANETITNTDTVDMFQSGGYFYLLRGEKDVTKTINGGGNSIVANASVATVSLTSHGYNNNQWVRVANASPADFNGDWQISNATTNTFTYVMPTSPSPSAATGTILVNRLKVPLRWDGNQTTATFTALSHGTISGNFINMPTSNFGMLQMNRAVLEYNRNAIIISAISNAESYDSIYGVFTFANGWSDYIVGVHPYQDNQVLVFLRRSIYLLNGINGDVSAMTSQLLTAQIGCIARKSIRTCGPDVLFLSDLGVFRLQPGYELTLRGNWEPLSAAVEPTIRTINFASLNTPCSAYWNNRYYLAVPTGTNTRNDTILVYNFLINAWESLDYMPNGFYTDYMVVMKLNNAATPFLISKEGGIYAAEQNEMDDFAQANQAAMQYPIVSKLKTRRLIFDTYNLKRFNRAIVNAKMDANSSMTVTCTVVNPDGSSSLASVSTIAANETTRPMPIGKRGYGLELEFDNASGRCQVVNYSVGAYETGFKTIPST